MKIAVLSDLHGNQYAFQKVLEDIRKAKIEKLLILGDVVGYYYRPDIILEELKQWDFSFIRGNHEDILLKLKHGQIDGEELRKKYGSGHKEALKRLSEAEIEFITQAPTKNAIQQDDCSVLMSHGAPFELDYYLYPDSPKDVLEKCADSNYSIVLTGHSHYPFVYKTVSSLLVNVGSVGQSRRRGGLAEWAIINTENQTVQLNSTPYDTEALIQEVEAIDSDIVYLKNILIRNK